MALPELSSNLSSSISSLLRKRSPQGLRQVLRPLGMLVAMALFLSGGTLHAETLLLSSLTTNPDATISGPGGLIYSHFTCCGISGYPASIITVTIDSISAAQSRIQFGSFTAAPAPVFAAITYQVTSTIGPITDFHLVSPGGIEVGTGRAFVDAGILVSADVSGIGSTFVYGVSPQDRTLMNVSGGDTPFPQVLPVIFPSGLATLSISNFIQMSGPDSTVGGSPTNASLTLPHFDNVYTVAVVPEPSTWLLLASGLISLIFLRRSALKRQRGD